MKRLILAATILTSVIAVSSCSKDSSSTTSTGNQMAYQLQATNPTSSMSRTTASGTITWTSGFANPSMVKFEAKKDNNEIELTSKNTEQIDIFSSVSASFGGFSIPAGNYDHVELKIDLDKNGSSPALQLNGEVTDGNTTIPVVFKVNEDVEIQTDSSDVTITNNGSFVAVTTIDLSALTAGLTADALLNAHLTDGTIEISSSSNIIIYYTLLQNFKNKHHHCWFKH